MLRIVFAAAALALLSATTANAAVYFDLHRMTMTGSVLYETWQDTSTGKVYAQQSWRAGSGSSTDACQVGYGWIPTGTYDLWGHWDHYDATIKGRVWYLSNHQCWNGTWRSELFIHSEETADNGQLCGSPYYDERYCWDGDGDYYSHGCIKVSRAAPYPSDLAQVDNDWDGWDGRHGSFVSYSRAYVYS